MLRWTFFFFYSVAALGGRRVCLERKHQVAGWTSGHGHFWFICAFQNYVADLFTPRPFVSPPRFCSGNHPHPPIPTNRREYPPLQAAVSSAVQYTHIHTWFKNKYSSHRQSSFDSALFRSEPAEEGSTRQSFWLYPWVSYYVLKVNGGQDL